MGENPQSSLILISDEVYPLFKVVYGGDDAYRESQTIDVSEFVGEKSFKAKGKRITTLEVASVEELEPTRFPAPKEEDGPADTDVPTPEEETDENPNDVRDELIGQLHFDLE